MNLSSPLVARSHRNLNTTRHIKAIGKERFADHECRAYCMCGHKPSIVPIKRKNDAGNQVETFVAMCSTCMPGGTMDLPEFKAPYLALQDFEDNCRLGLAGVDRHAI